jgi:hypothetical protein
MGGRTQVLLQRVLGPESSIAVITLEDMSRRVEVLLECMRAPEGSIAAIALEDMS